MSKTSTKPSGRSAKAARATAVKTAKKPAKSARGAPKAAAKTARGAVSIVLIDMRMPTYRLTKYRLLD